MSNMGHIARMPVSVSFRPVLAPESIAPPLDASSFTYDFGIRTAGPARVNVRSTPIQAATVVPVPCKPRGVFTFEAPVGGVDYFAAGTFIGDQPAIFTLTLAANSTGKVVASARAGYSADTLLEVPAGLPEGAYTMYLVQTGSAPSSVTAYLNVWQLSYGGSGGAGTMQVAPNPVAVGADGMGLLSLKIAGLPLPGAADMPPTRCVYMCGALQPPMVSSGLGVSGRHYP